MENLTEFAEITLKTRELFNRYNRAFAYENMEACFTNVFIWQKSWNIRYAVLHDTLVLCMCSGRKRPFLLAPMPRESGVSVRPAMEACVEIMRRRLGYFEMRSVCGILKEKIERDCDGLFAFAPQRSMAEYVYRTQDLVALPGDRYHAKRNHINRFVKSLSLIHI